MNQYSKFINISGGNRDADGRIMLGLSVRIAEKTFYVQGDMPGIKDVLVARLCLAGMFRTMADTLEEDSKGRWSHE